MPISMVERWRPSCGRSAGFLIKSPTIPHMAWPPLSSVFNAGANLAERAQGINQKKKTFPLGNRRLTSNDEFLIPPQSPRQARQCIKGPKFRHLADLPSNSISSSEYLRSYLSIND